MNDDASPRQAIVDLFDARSTTVMENGPSLRGCAGRVYLAFTVTLTVVLPVAGAVTENLNFESPPEEAISELTSPVAVRLTPGEEAAPEKSDCRPVVGAPLLATTVTLHVMMSPALAMVVRGLFPEVSTASVVGLNRDSSSEPLQSSVDLSLGMPITVKEVAELHWLVSAIRHLMLNVLPPKLGGVMLNLTAL
jgi:hypothetical protein